MSKFDGKVAIVTGGAAGIGGATSRLLAEQGASVLIADINMAEAEANAEAIRAGGGTAETISTNVGKHEEIAAMVQHAIDRWGRLDILVNNAFSPTDEGDGDALTVTEDAWDAGMATLVKAHFLAAKHAVPHMRESGGGSIVNISSVHGLAHGAPQAHLRSRQVRRHRRHQADGDRLRPRRHPRQRHLPRSHRHRAAAGTLGRKPRRTALLRGPVPVRRTGTPLDIANAVAFLSSDEASFITGHALVVDGGLTIQLQEDFSVRQVHYIREHPDARMPY